MKAKLLKKIRSNFVVMFSSEEDFYVKTRYIEAMQRERDSAEISICRPGGMVIKIKEVKDDFKFRNGERLATQEEFERELKDLPTKEHLTASDWVWYKKEFYKVFDKETRDLVEFKSLRLALCHCVMNLKDVRNTILDENGRKYRAYKAIRSAKIIL